MFKAIMLVGLGGGLGSILRYLSSQLTNKIPNLNFPLGTFLVNIAGCLLVGILIGLFSRAEFANSNWKFMLITGFCGGFTTFSAFSAESISMFQSGNSFLAILYIAASVLVGLLAVWLGMVVVES